MKTIKVKFVDIDENPRENPFGKISKENPYKNNIRETLEKRYILDEESYPDYVFTYVPVSGAKGNEYSQYKDAVTIFVQYENVFPDFYCYDYCIGLDHALRYGDRYFYIDAMVSDNVQRQAYDLIAKKHMSVTADLAKRKFCAITAGNFWQAARQRRDMLNLLSSYKQVDSGGKSLNNVGGPVKDKLQFESEYKFVIAFDNVENGFVQDKIGMAFAAGTIPIYWGNPSVTDIYNEKAFINCHNYNSFEDVLERVRELDEDDEKYLAMLREPAVLHEKSLEQWDEELGDFLSSIIEQPKMQAIKRRNEMWSGIMQEMRVEGFKRLYRKEKRKKIMRDIQGKVLHALYIPVKKTKLGKNIKRKILGRMERKRDSDQDKNYYGGN